MTLPEIGEDAAALPSRTEADSDGRAIVPLNDVLHVDAERLVPWHEHRFPERAQALMASIDRFEVGKVAAGPELDLRVSKFQQRVEVAGVPSRIYGANDLHVLLQHRPGSIPRPSESAAFHPKGIAGSRPSGGFLTVLPHSDSPAASRVLCVGVR